MVDNKDIQFDVFTLKNSLSELYRGNEFIETEARVLRLIALLVAAYPSTVSRRELLDLLWPRQEISDASLTQLIRRARLLLDDDGRQPRFIKTVHGVGVRFLMEPRPVDMEAQVADTRTETSYSGVSVKRKHHRSPSWLKGVGLLFLLLLVVYYFFSSSAQNIDQTSTTTPRVALLPIENASKDDAYQWVVWGLMDMLGHQLAQTGLLNVVASKDIYQYLSGGEPHSSWQDTNNLKRDYARICGAIGCDYLLVSRLQTSEKLSKLGFYLVGKEGVYPEQLVLGGDPLQAGERLVEQVIALIQPEHPQTKKLQQTYSGNSLANQAYALGVQASLKGEYVRAQKYFGLALEEEPDFLWASYRLASATASLGDSDAASKRLTELLSNKDLPELLLRRIMDTQSMILYGEGKLQQALNLSRELRQRLQADGDATRLGGVIYWIAVIQRAQGHIDEALANLSEARSLFLKTGYTRGLALSEYILASINLDQGNILKALDGFRRAETLFRKLENKRYIAMVLLSHGNTLLRIGKSSQARQVLENARKLYAELHDKEGTLYVKAYEAEVDIDDGEYQQAIDELLKLNKELATTTLVHHKSLTSVFMARAYANLHQLDKAQEYLRVSNEYQFTPYRDVYRLLPAHIKYEQHQFEAAVNLAEEIKRRPGEWSSNAERVLAGYKKALKSNVWSPMVL